MEPQPQDPGPALAGARALVTGSTRGLGFEVAQRLAREGAHVGVHGRQPADAQRVAHQIVEAGGSASAHAAELDEPAQLDDLIGDLVAGPTWDILVNCAGVATREPIADISRDNWELTMDVNLTAPLRLSQAVARGMADQGWGRIVNVSSLSGLRPPANAAAYSISKAALNMLTKALAVELGPSGVRSNAICPTIFPTDMTRELWGGEEGIAAKAANIPARRLATAEELAGVIAFLCCPAADYINGALIPVDGGLLASTSV